MAEKGSPRKWPECLYVLTVGLRVGWLTGLSASPVVACVLGSRASFYYRVRLSQVDGYWSENFAFDLDGYLWLSSGNRRPAHLYKVVESRPQRVFTSAKSIRGLSFIADNILIYANFRQSIRPPLRYDRKSVLQDQIFRHSPMAQRRRAGPPVENKKNPAVEPVQESQTP